jgi:hypothetical protein
MCVGSSRVVTDTEQFEQEFIYITLRIAFVFLLPF